MRIFYVTTKSETGGVQTHISQLAQYLVNRGNDVAVMAYPGGWLGKKTQSFGAVFYPNKFLSNSINPIKDFRATKMIKKAIEDFKPDLVSCHSTKAGFLTRLAVRNRIPTIFTAHGWGFTKGVPFLRKYLVIFLEKLVSRYCSKIICVSDFDRNLALKYNIAPEKKLLTIYNGVEINNSRDVDSRIQIPDSKISIIFVGRLTKQKDPLLLVETFYDLPDRLKNKAVISIIGDGPKRQEVEKFVKENGLADKIKLVGVIPRNKVLEILEDSDIFVLTSHWEGFPFSILEAMSYGLAVIASDVGGVSEAIRNCGILVKPGDKNSLRESLKKLLENQKLAKELGRKAREEVEKKFSLERMIKATERIYQNLLSSPKE